MLVGGDIGTVTSDHKQISWEKGGTVTPTIADPLPEQLAELCCFLLYAEESSLRCLLIMSANTSEPLVTKGKLPLLENLHPHPNSLSSVAGCSLGSGPKLETDVVSP